MGSLEKPRWKFFQEFLSDDHVEVGFGGTATKAQVVAFVASPVCVVKSYSVDSFELEATTTAGLIEDLKAEAPKIVVRAYRLLTTPDIIRTDGVERLD